MTYKIKTAAEVREIVEFQEYVNGGTGERTYSAYEHEYCCLAETANALYSILQRQRDGWVDAVELLSEDFTGVIVEPRKWFLLPDDGLRFEEMTLAESVIMSEMGR